jgi:hypothetical protein
MKCPHCLVEFHDNPAFGQLGIDDEGAWNYEKRKCPSCNKFIFWLTCGHAILVIGYSINNCETSKLEYDKTIKHLMVYPKSYSRNPCPTEVPDPIATDYKEACVVISDSPKASAALSRRCLQNLLRDKGGVTPSDLSNEILSDDLVLLRKRELFRY